MALGWHFNFGVKRRIIPKAVEQFHLLIEKVKKVADIRIVITYSWRQRAKDLEDLKAQLEGFSFKDRVIDAVAFSDYSDKHFLEEKESEKIRKWLLKSEKWDVKFSVATSRFSA